jgi:Rod binding domain-containing protein
LERKPEQAGSKAQEAAAQFEQIFLRKLVGSLMESAKFGMRSQMPGSGVYDSMVVDALAGSISSKGGIGLAALVQRRIDEAMGKQSDAGGPAPVSVSLDAFRRQAAEPVPISTIPSSLAVPNRLSSEELEHHPMVNRRIR